MPHYYNLLEKEYKIPDYHSLNLPTSVTSVIMQLRLNFNRIVVHNKFLTLNGWFCESENNTGLCGLRSDKIEDFEHFIYHCNISNKNHLNLNHYKNKSFYDNLSYNDSLLIYNTISKYFYVRYKEI